MENGSPFFILTSFMGTRGKYLIFHQHKIHNAGEPVYRSLPLSYYPGILHTPAGTALSPAAFDFL